MGFHGSSVLTAVGFSVAGLLLGMSVWPQVPRSLRGCLPSRLKSCLRHPHAAVLLAFIALAGFPVGLLLICVTWVPHRCGLWLQSAAAMLGRLPRAGCHHHGCSDTKCHFPCLTGQRNQAQAGARHRSAPPRTLLGHQGGSPLISLPRLKMTPSLMHHLQLQKPVPEEMHHLAMPLPRHPSLLGLHAHAGVSLPGTPHSDTDGTDVSLSGCWVP